MGLVNGIVNSIMGPLNAIFNAAGAALDIVGSVFQFLDDIISFLNCEIAPECPEVDKLSTWLGSEPESTTIDAGNLVKKIDSLDGIIGTATALTLSLIHISEPTRLGMISNADLC